MDRRIVFITGGARSGKSRFALREASRMTGKRFFIATATPSDDEMAERIAHHRQDRSDDWQTIEEPLRIAAAISRTASGSVVILDCLTLWLANMMEAGWDISRETDNLIASIDSCRSSVFVVSNEVGLGIVPDNEMARAFRDLAGFLNQRVAEAADEAYLMAAGIPIRIK